MKRSEAVAQMSGYLTGYFRDKHPEELMALAEHCIRGAESIGMMPPPKIGAHTYGHLKDAVQHKTILIDWCPEWDGDLGEDDDQAP